MRTGEAEAAKAVDGGAQALSGWRRAVTSALVRQACPTPSEQLTVAKSSGAHRPGCKLGVSLLLPPSFYCLGTLCNIFLLGRTPWALI